MLNTIKRIRKCVSPDISDKDVIDKICSILNVDKQLMYEHRNDLYAQLLLMISLCPTVSDKEKFICFLLYSVIYKRLNNNELAKIFFDISFNHLKLEEIVKYKDYEITEFIVSLNMLYESIRGSRLPLMLLSNQLEQVDYDQFINAIYSMHISKNCNEITKEKLYETSLNIYRDIFEYNINRNIWNNMYYNDYKLIECIINKFEQSYKDKLHKDDFLGISSYIRENYAFNNLSSLFIVEPHPDDAIGSAVGLLLNRNCVTNIYTIAKTEDKRDTIDLVSEMNICQKLEDNIINIKFQNKLMITDYHWDYRLDSSIGYDNSSLYYADNYNNITGTSDFNRLEEGISQIVRKSKENDAILAFPLGIKHPMHILITHLCIKYIKELDFDTKKVIIYIDHPYDYIENGIKLINHVMGYIERQLGIVMVRYDDRTIEQDKLDKLVKSIYGEKHHYEFAGCFDKVLNSYYLADNSPLFEKIGACWKRNDVLFVTSQAKPFVKTGGLGEVAFHLAQSLNGYVNSIRIMMPMFKNTNIDYEDISIEHLQTININILWKNEIKTCTVYSMKYAGIIYYLIDIPGYFEQTRLFGNNNDGEAFSCFCNVILESLPLLNYKPSIIHCHDWQTGFIPFLKHTMYSDNSFYRDIKTVFTIHTFGYQGIFDKEGIYNLLNITSEASIDEKLHYLSQEDSLKTGATLSQISFMRAGVCFADKVSTVSEKYAQQILVDPMFKGRILTGIRNGIDYDIYNPTTDKRIFKNYSSNTFEHGKKENKIKLQQLLGLPKDELIPIICMVSRLVGVKGIHTVKNIIEILMEENLQFIIIGDDEEGSDYFNRYFSQIQAKYSSKFRYNGYKGNEDMEFKTYAGSDILLMPSLDEACGTSQLLAMRYGTVPAVSLIAGLEESLTSYYSKDRHPDKGVGFFYYKDNPWITVNVLKEALKLYSNQTEWNMIVKKCMDTDFSWENKSTVKYVKLYEQS